MALFLVLHERFLEWRSIEARTHFLVGPLLRKKERPHGPKFWAYSKLARFYLAEPPSFVVDFELAASFVLSSFSEQEEAAAAFALP